MNYNCSRVTYRNASKYGMEIIAEKSKVMVNTCKSTHTDIYIYGSKIEEVAQFKYVGAPLTKDGSSNQEI